MDSKSAAFSSATSVQNIQRAVLYRGRTKVSLERITIMQNLIPNKVPQISWSQIRLMLVIGIGILIVILIFRRFLNILIIDMCILGDYSTCPCVRRNRTDRMGSTDESGDNHNPNDRSWNSRDAIALVNLGAFTNPYKYLYHNLSDEKRKKILEIILRKKEVSVFIPSVIIL